MLILLAELQGHTFSSQFTTCQPFLAHHHPSLPLLPSSSPSQTTRHGIRFCSATSSLPSSCSPSELPGGSALLATLLSEASHPSRTGRRSFKSMVLYKKKKALHHLLLLLCLATAPWTTPAPSYPDLCPTKVHLECTSLGSRFSSTPIGEIDKCALASGHHCD